MRTSNYFIVDKNTGRPQPATVGAFSGHINGSLRTSANSGYAAPRKAWTVGKITSAASSIAIAVILGGLASSSLGQGTSESEGFVNPKDIKWGAAPPSIPAGAKIAVLQGDPSKAGPFVVRLMVPRGYKIPPHWHTQDESLTVISGTFYLGTGDKVEANKSHTLSAGAFHFLSGKDHHFLVARSDAVIQINGNGPFDVTYISADDDPRQVQAVQNRTRADVGHEAAR